MDSVVAEIVRRERGSVVTLRVLTGGAQNIAYRAETAMASYVVRLNKDYAATYAKERWAMERAAEAGVPVPKVYATGRQDGYDYIVMEWIEGVTGIEYRGDTDALYRNLGRQAALLAKVPVEGYGWDLTFSPYPRFTRGWSETVAKDRDYIFGGGTLSGLAVLEASMLDRVRGFMDEYGGWTLPARLCHNDICPDNVIVGTDGLVYLIDWANACGQPAPLFEIARTGRGVADPDHIWPFAEGHGLTGAEWRAAAPTINRLRMVHVLRAVAWAARDAPQYLDEFAAEARTLIQAFA